VRSQATIIFLALALSIALTTALAFGDSPACRIAGDPTQSAAGADAFSRALSRGPAYAALAALLGGLAVSLTPCVYPMIAVTVSVFGARETRSRRHGLALSAAFVLGIVAMFVPLGVVAGLTGTMFGAVLQHRLVIVGVSGLFLVLAASMFGAFEFTLPSALANRLTTMGGFGFKGAFALGLVSGLIAAPCTGPVLTGILVWIAQTQDALLGGAAMAAFALGLGTPFFVVGAFAVQLPKSGRWMVHVKSALGLVLAVVALYFLGSAFPQLPSLASGSTAFLAATAALTVAGIVVGAVHLSFEQSSLGVKIRKTLGIILVAFAGTLFVFGLGKPTASLAWENLSYEQAQAKAIDRKQPLLVDFTATWCEGCKKLDRVTFSEPSVASEAGRFVAIKVDATDDEDPVVERVKQKLKVVGLPTVLLFDSRGREVVRCTDFVPADSFLQILKQVE
jgi:thiol:disulfide interchange protein DsbD